MFLFDSLLHRRFGVFLAWLAVAALGAASIARDAGGFERLVGPAGQSSAAALHDAGHPFVRISGLKLASYIRASDDDRRSGSADPATLPPLFALPARETAISVIPATRFLPRNGRVATPYSARAPPFAII